jgi:hypothetical protein
MLKLLVGGKSRRTEGSVVIRNPSGGMAAVEGCVAPLAIGPPARRPSARLREGVRHRTHAASRRHHQVLERFIPMGRGHFRGTL